MPRMSSRTQVLVWLGVLAGTALTVIAVGALLMAPLARHVTRQALSSLEGVQGSFLSASIDPLTLTYSLENLRLVADDAHPADPPLLTMEQFQFHLHGRDLLRGKLTASAVVANAKLAMRLTKEAATTVPDPGAEVGSLPPVRLTRIELHDCELLLTDATISPVATFWVHEVEGELRDLASRSSLASAHAPAFKLHGTVQRSGKVTLSGTLDPLASAPAFEGEMSVTGLQLRELYALVVPRTGFHIPKGTLSATGAFQASDGRLRGRLQPVFSGLEIRSADGNVLRTAEAGLANAAIAVLPDRFAPAHPATFDLLWTNPGVLWDEIMKVGLATLPSAVVSALVGEKPAPPVSSPKGSTPREAAKKRQTP